MKCESCLKECEFDDLREGTFVQRDYFLCSDCDEGAPSIFDNKNTEYYKTMYGTHVQRYDPKIFNDHVEYFEYWSKIHESVRKADKERKSIAIHVLGAPIVALILLALFFV